MELLAVDVDRKIVSYRDEKGTEHTLTFEEFFSSMPHEAKLQLADEIKLGLRMRGKNGYEIFNFLSEVWNEYESILAR